MFVGWGGGLGFRVLAFRVLGGIGFWDMFFGRALGAFGGLGSKFRVLALADGI